LDAEFGLDDGGVSVGPEHAKDVCFVGHECFCGEADDDGAGGVCAAHLGAGGSVRDDFVGNGVEDKVLGF